MRKIITLFLFFCSVAVFAQVKGVVSDEKGNPLPFVSIYIDGSYIGTTTNEKGEYELMAKPSKYILVFQYLGYKTQRIKHVIDHLPKKVNVTMVEEQITLNEVVIDRNHNPADEVIRKAIASKKENSEQTAKYSADFYSRGIFRIKDAPKKILGQKFDAFDEVLDSTRSGILYLSETISKIEYQKPDKLKETIIASKVSGNDNGFSFNNAASADFDFYENYIALQTNVVSPIANNAFNYYKYKLEGTFFEGKHQINKIKVTPKRMSEPAMEGYIYIVEDSWALFATDLKIRGNQMQMPVLNEMTLKQSYIYNDHSKIWVKNTQTLDFIAGIFNTKFTGRFTYVFSNYRLDPAFTKQTFGAEVLRFADDANKKENAFWDRVRPVPLTEEESNDYIKKDALQVKKKSQVYLDSIDAKGNKFGWLDPITGYSYKNSYRKWELGYDGLLMGIGFNTVQGFNFNTGLYFTRRDEEKRTYSTIRADFNYGLDEKRFRATASYINRFSNTNFSELRVSGGSSVAQFNENNPIGRIVNSISTLFFKDNYMKLFEKNFAKASFGREFFNGFHATAGIEYSERKPLWNHTEQVIIQDTNDWYTSNNPRAPNDHFTPAIVKHNLIKANVLARYTFGQKYWTRPDGKFRLSDDKYPVVYAGYEKGFGGSESKYDFDHVHARVTYDVTLGNKGNLGMNLKAGKFFNADNIAFVDYKHFNGNLTHIGTADRYLNVFNLLPYYTASTNDAYFEAHAEHDDQGYIMNKLPLLNKLKSTLVLGYHHLSVPDRSPYHEFTAGLDNLGFGKFKVFRVDYIHSYQAGNHQDGVVFGIKLLNVLE
ncbi:DUF5686 and carboxypeptidase regulatory-like domain-containing protein [Flavobacterium caeni]|uniref:CarboxypepD_reg-like domain-containing protein n=1 Tax=Flavobacterium caeni TaxID=490189 RepID=A0A1G5HNE5_9FLAO|nr:DUF5686 and carboxypeptidase regulatory-like domain-containing protein [Flavobacterium caeni]SCY64558.1 CarboxypepD_reg-like domain-containing protein [Flavobacterium caeni]